MVINGKSAAAALVKARSAIGATVGKDARGNFGKYATLAAVMEAITPALAANGLALVQEAELDDSAVTMAATLLHESGETIEFAPLTMPLGNVRTPQAVGSAMTYGRRYQLTALFGLAPDDDDEEAASKTSTDAQGRQNGHATPVSTPKAQNGPQRAATPATAHIDDAPALSQDGPDNPFEDNSAGATAEPARASDKTLRRLHVNGTAVYGDAWDGKRHELVAAITGGRTHSSGQLTEAEARRMIAGIEAKRAQQQQPDAKHRTQREA